MSISVLLAAILATALPEVEVATLDGSTVTGSLLALTADGVKLTTADGEQTVPANRLLSLATKQQPALPDEKPTVWIDLVDGSRLVGTGFTSHKGLATLTAGEDQYEIPTNAIARVRFSSPETQAATWPAEVGKNAAGDLLAVKKAEAVDFLEGVLGNVTEASGEAEGIVEFQIDGETIPVKRSKIDGLIYYHKAGEKFADPVCVVDDSQGGRLQAKSISLDGDGQLEVTTLAGPVVRRSWSTISRLDFSSGKVTYLSDLEPQNIEWKPVIDFGDSAPAVAEFYALRRDRGRENDPLRVGGKSYPKGIAIASRTAVTYRLPSGATRFKAIASIDEAVRQAGNVMLTISVDGKQLLIAPVIGLADPVQIDLDVAGARRLTILVDYGEDLDTGDYLNLADARIVK